jgi:Tfp pilus assembly protein PilF
LPGFSGFPVFTAKAFFGSPIPQFLCSRGRKAADQNIETRETVLFETFAMRYQDHHEPIAQGCLASPAGRRWRPSIATVIVGCVAIALAGCVTTTSRDPNFGKKDQTSAGAGAAAAAGPATIGQSIGKTFKSGTDKIAAALKPKDDTPLDGRVIEKPWWPFPKKDPVPGSDFYVQLARVQEQSGSYDSALADYDKALAIDDEYAPALVGCAHVYDRLGQKVKATEYYLRAIKAHPKDASIANDLGLCYARQGKFDLALKHLGKAVELQPDRVLYRNNIATVLVELGRIDEAVDQVAKVYGEPIAHYNVGIVLNQRGRRKAAAEQFALAVEKDPGLEQAREWLARLETDPEPQTRLASAESVEPLGNDPNGSAANAAGSANDPQEATSRVRRPIQVAARATDDRAVAASPATVAQPSIANGASLPGIPPAPDEIRQLPSSAPDAVNELNVRPLPTVQSDYVPPSRY